MVGDSQKLQRLRLKYHAYDIRRQPLTYVHTYSPVHNRKDLKSFADRFTTSHHQALCISAPSSDEMRTCQLEH